MSESGEGSSELPAHIAVIMDGNGRWAEKRGLSRFRGHEKGAETAEEIVTFCAKKGISYVTLYTFSLENWKRPRREIVFLMNLLKKFLRTRTRIFTENSIRFRAVGRISMLDSSVCSEIRTLEKTTADCTRMTLCLALSYGGREEILDAAREACIRVQHGEFGPEDLTPDRFKECMQTSDIPYPDILIRTGSEMRLSNFFLWQMSYTELFFTDTMWPDFNTDELNDIIREYQGRERRFGGV